MSIGRGRPQGSPPRIHAAPALTMITMWGGRRRRGNMDVAFLRGTGIGLKGTQDDRIEMAPGT